MVIAEMGSMQMILRNLLPNAIKFTPNNGQITIKTQQENEHLRISIKDSGAGTPQEQIAKIKDQTLFHSTLGTEQEQGTGPGLKLCFDYLKKNNSELQINSKPRKGAEFYFYLG